MKVNLRPIHASDEEQVLRWRNDAEVARYMYTDTTIDAEEHRRWFSTMLCNSRVRYWIIQWGETEVGVVNLYDIDMLHSRAAWAFYLADPIVRGKGVGRAVEYLILKHVFEEAQFQKLWCEVLDFNTAVIEMHQSCGFAVEGVFRKHILKQGEYHDVFRLGILASDWPAVKGAMEERLRVKELI